MDEPIIFRAAFPAIQSAIKVGDAGMRIQLDVPESEMAQAVRLITLRDVVLRVTVEADDTQKRNGRKSKATRDFTILDTKKSTHDG
jgi:hypothetical protein